MPKALGLEASVTICHHATIQVDVSSPAFDPTVNFKRVPPEKRVAATTSSGRVVTSSKSTSDGSNNNNNNPFSKLPSDYTFPAPLVLPGDSLSIDPKEPPQSLRSFIREDARNPLTSRRKTLYVGRVGSGSGDGQETTTPTTDRISQLAKSWSIPVKAAHKNAPRSISQLEHPKTEEIIDYLSAYYSPLKVKPLLAESSSSACAKFVKWDEDGGDDDDHDKPNPKPAKTQSRRKGAKIKTSPEKPPTYIGLQLGEGVTRVRTRPCPDGEFPRQVNLNDIMDGLLEVIPPDAHTAILLVDQDMYDDEEDIFCCGLAYGGSRVAVVSTARYHPALDSSHSKVPTPVVVGSTLHGELLDEIEYRVDRNHMWPGSHCRDFVERVLQDNGPKKKKAKTVKDSVNGSGSDGTTRLEEIIDTPIGAAIKAATLSFTSAEEDLSGLWFSRVARTAAHELGHCFCLAHCVYYACSMQGTSCLAEDMRQPPYLCPVCLAKLTRAILDVEKGLDQRGFVLQRYRALLGFCEKKKGVAMFAAFHAWLERRIDEVEDDL